VSTHEGKNLPRPTAQSRPFWDGCREGRLLLQRCRACGRHQFYPRLMCVHCDADALDWVEAAGSGRLESFTVVRRAVSAAYAPETPYVVALVALDEGPVMMSNVVGCDPETLVVGTRLRVLFEAWTPEVSVPKFTPAA
jgi:uncharacterized OB-fold protein